LSLIIKNIYTGSLIFCFTYAEFIHTLTQLFSNVHINIITKPILLTRTIYFNNDLPTKHQIISSV